MLFEIDHEPTWCCQDWMPSCLMRLDIQIQEVNWTVCLITCDRLNQNPLIMLL